MSMPGRRRGCRSGVEQIQAGETRQNDTDSLVSIVEWRVSDSIHMYFK